MHRDRIRARVRVSFFMTVSSLNNFAYPTKTPPACSLRADKPRYHLNFLSEDSSGQPTLPPPVTAGLRRGLLQFSLRLPGGTHLSRPLRPFHQPDALFEGWRTATRSRSSPLRASYGRPGRASMEDMVNPRNKNANTQQKHPGVARVSPGSGCRAPPKALPGPGPAG